MDEKSIVPSSSKVPKPKQDEVVKVPKLELEEAFRASTEQVLYLDVSASMLSEWPDAPEISRAKAARSLAEKLINEWLGTAICYVFDGSVRSLWSEARSNSGVSLPSPNKLRGEHLKRAMSALRFDGTSTDIIRVFRDASMRARVGMARRAMEVLIVTDGFDSALVGWRPGAIHPLTEFVEALRQASVPVSVVHVAPTGVVDDYLYCSEELRRVCQYTGGKYSRVSTAKEFEQAMIRYWESPRLPEPLRLLTEGEK